MSRECDENEGYPTGKTVPFPYDEPYPQQVAFMDSLLKALKHSRKQCRGTPVFFMESPTGTGKSLSLACATTSWLRYQEKCDLTEPQPSGCQESLTSTGVDWVDHWIPTENRDKMKVNSEKVETASRTRRDLAEKLESLRSVTDRVLRVRRDCAASRKEPDSKKRRLMKELHGAQLDGSLVNSSDAVGGVTPGAGVRKIVYAARTHTQLSQFVSELRRIPKIGENLRVVALGSRRTLCGNENVSRLSERNATETCLDLQKGGKEKSKGCPLLESKIAVDTLALHTLAQPTDAEEAARMGRKSKACSYYAARAALPAAEVVVLPYSLLLSSPAQKAVGLSLKGAFVVVDEAHNLPEAIRSVNSCRVSLSIVEQALAQLNWYVQKYQDRIASESLAKLGQLRRLLLAMQKHLTGNNRKTAGERRMRTAVELMVLWKLGSVNYAPILTYMEETRLAQKLMGYRSTVKDLQGQQQLVEDMSKYVSAMSIVESFLKLLLFNGEAGKVVTDWPSSASETNVPRVAALRYVLLKPSVCFQQVLKDAHAVALVGGTMQPFALLAYEVLDSVIHEKTLETSRKCDTELRNRTDSSPFFMHEAGFTGFTCDHVVPAKNVLLQAWGEGPAGGALDFRHKQRSLDTTIDELGMALVSVLSNVPSGVVVFLPSYAYEASVVRRWKATGLWGKFLQLKKLHREPKRSNEINVVLQSYSEDTKRESGALLLSVVGGKLSEGINFANDMARCVVLVGLPFPDITDPVLKEKMGLMDSSDSAISGDEYYFSLCMRAVNQSIGRAIRHARDYAAVVLMDGRYTRESRVHNSLPAWLTRHSCLKEQDHGDRCEQLRSFFRCFET